MNKNPFVNLLLAALGIAVVLAGIAVLIAAINLGAQIAGHGVVLAFQIVLTLLGVVISVTISIAIGVVAWESVTRRLEILRKNHADLLKKMRKRTPVYAATIVLAAEAFKIIGDKALKTKRACRLWFH